jgi:hypothetical protein
MPSANPCAISRHLIVKGYVSLLPPNANDVAFPVRVHFALIRG